jgi:hypothetical protein
MDGEPHSPGQGSRPEESWNKEGKEHAGGNSRRAQIFSGRTRDDRLHGATEEGRELQMKRKQMMRVLAMALAASVVVTAQGVPAGLTTVYAEDYTPDTLSGLTVDGSAVYAKVTTKTHTHDISTCFDTQEDGTVEEVAAGDKYYKSISEEDYNALVAANDGAGEGDDYLRVEKATAVVQEDPSSGEEGGEAAPKEYNYYQKVDVGGFVLDPSEPVDETWTVPENCDIVEDSDDSTQAAVYDEVTNKDELLSVNLENANSSTSLGSYVIYLETDDIDTIKAAHKSTASAGSVTEQQKDLTANGASIEAAGYFTVSKYTKANSTVTASDAADIPGAIVIPALGGSVENYDAYTAALGFNEVEAGEIYVPSVIAISDYEAAKNDEATVGGVDYLAVTNGDGDVVWVNMTNKTPANQPAAAWVYDSASSSFILQVVTELTDSDLDATVDHNDYYYYAPHIHKTGCTVTGCTAEGAGVSGTADGGETEFDAGTVELVETQIKDDEIAKIIGVERSDESGVYDYYYDIAGSFATKIELTKSAKQYATSQSKETDLDDGVTITMGGEAQAVTVEKDAVTSDYDENKEYKGDGSDDVQITAIEADAMYFHDVNGNHIIDDGDIGLVSEIKDYRASNLTSLGLAGSTTSFAVETMIAPTMSIADNGSVTGTLVENEENVYDASPGFPSVSINKNRITAGDGWTYQWAYQMLDENSEPTGNEIKVGSSVALSSLDASYTPDDIVGHYQVYLLATNTTAGITATSDKVELYVVKPWDVTVSHDGSTYTGSEVEDPTISDSNDSGDYSKGNPSSYVYCKESDKSAVNEGTQTATSGLPKGAGSYYIGAVFDNDFQQGLLGTTVYTSSAVTINKATIASIDAGSTTVALAESTEEEHTVDLSGVLAKYEAEGTDKFTGTFAIPQKAASPFKSISFEDDVLTFTLEDGLSAETYADGVKLTAELTNSNYTVTAATIKVMILSSDTIVHDFSSLADPITVYYGDYDADSIKELIAPANATGEELGYYSVTFGDTSTDTYPTDVQENGELIYITYDNSDASGENDYVAEYGTATTTLVIKQKALTLTASDETIDLGGAFRQPWGYTVATKEEDVADGSKAVNTLPSGLTATAKITDNNGSDDEVASIDTGKSGSYTLTFEIAGEDSAKYTVDVKTATLTVNGAAQDAPAADPVLDFTADKTNGNYTLVIDDSALGADTLEYSLTEDGFGASDDKTEEEVSEAVKAALEEATYASGETVTFFVRYAADSTHEASAAREVTAQAPAALTVPTIEAVDDTDGGKTVTITSTDEDVTIYYTVDGNEPTEADTEYTAAFTVAAEDLPATVKAIAVKENVLDSAVASEELTEAPDEGDDETDPDDGNADDNTAPDDGNADDNTAPDDGNADDNTAPDDSTADDNTAGDNNANDNTAGDNNANDNTANDNTAGDNNANDNTAGDNNANDNTAGDNNANDNTAGDNNANDNTAGDNNANGNTGDTTTTPSTGTDSSTATTGTTASTTTATGETHIEAAADGTMTIVDAGGAAVTSAKVTIGGNDYITDATGEVVTDALTTTPSGNTVYAGKDGAIVKNKTVTVSGKKYYATKTGKIAKSGFYTTAKGNTVYATKSGQLKASKAFTVNGKKYVAKKSGALYKNTTVTIGNKKYTVNKKGVVTKTVTVK